MSLTEVVELIEYGLLIQFDNGLLGMANGFDYYLIPLCNDEEIY